LGLLARRRKGQGGDKRGSSCSVEAEERMLMLRAATARAASTVVAGARRRPGLLPVAVAGLSSSSSGPPSGGKRRKGQRRGEAKPQPQPLPGHSEIPSNKKANARPAKDRRKVRPAEEAPQGPSGQGQEIELRKQPPEKPKRVVRWRCATGCGACCKLDKGPEFPTPDEVFADFPDHLQLYKSMIGPDGWCNNYDKSNRTCNIYEDRPFFCRVEPKVFEEFFGVPRSKFDREACSACVDNIKMVYGQDSPELGNFKRVIREESSKHEASMNEVKLLDTTNTTGT
uniref:Zinc/iron-chelating domain-containing protein n=1 Tax=Aegilops tauschii subsp. strangulata TaxID=200361 RepID=A0A453PPW9_AEGTS